MVFDIFSLSPNKYMLLQRRLQLMCIDNIRFFFVFCFVFSFFFVEGLC